MARPDVSIVIPVYNTGSIMMETITSVQAQRDSDRSHLPRFEVIVINDGSTDPETKDLLSEIASVGDYIRVINNHRKKGLSGARNSGMDVSLGSWIAFLDSDDIWPPTSLADRWSVLKEYSQATWIAGHALKKYDPGTERFYPKLSKCLSENGLNVCPLEERAPYLYALIRDRYIRGEVSVLERPIRHLLHRDLVLPSSVMIGGCEAIRSLRFSEDLNRQEDLDFHLRLAATQNLYISPADVLHYRIREGSLIHNPNYCEGWEKFLMLKLLQEDDDIRPWLRPVVGAQEKALVSAIYLYRKRGRLKDAFRATVQFIKLRPWSPFPYKQAVLIMSEFARKGI